MPFLHALIALVIALEITHLGVQLRHGSKLARLDERTRTMASEINILRGVK